MPTRKINNEKEAAEAFSDRAFFRVGDRFISPDEIISARRIENGFQFTLSDGSTVQHDRFKKGSIGHFLFEQLSKVEGRFSETLKPNFNRVLADGSLWDNSGNQIRSYNITKPERISISSGYIFSPFNDEREDLTGGNVISLNNPLPAAMDKVLPTGNGTLIVVGADSNGVHASETDNEGNEINSILSGASYLEDRIDFAAIDRVNEKVFITTSSVSKVIGQFDFDGSGGLTTASTNDAILNVAADPDAQKVYVQNEALGEGAKSFDYGLTNPRNVFNFVGNSYSSVFEWNRNFGGLFVWLEGGNDPLEVRKPNGDLIKKLFSIPNQPPNGDTFDAGLDLSVL